MNVVTIDGAAIETRDALHDELSRQLRLPAWYGRNLDALYDCLTALQEDTELRLVHGDDLFAHLGIYADVLRSVLNDACIENSHLRIVCEED